ncbi:hypothetical protein E3N88_25208 [Mikania micrantha]|uniref:Iron-sulfur cluster biosynthesis family protein n=1 Tax=Mikania micrantha TaxID=192012 RepID=A0A5N6N5T9_9ASTR|nr:hypothetical protein E3N88_25208 [Mikania micrantha]
MASISTCFKITPKSYTKPSSIVSLEPSRQFHCSLRAHNDVFRTHFLTLGKHNGVSSGRSFVSEIRASGDDPSVVAPAVFRPGKIVESDKLPTGLRKQVMDALDKCGRRVTVGDVASMAGIKLTEAQKALQAIAADANGFLEVSDEGDILYVFPEDYQSKLVSKSLRIKTEPYLEKAKSVAGYLIRVTFGTALIASILIVYTTIIASLTSSSKESSRKSSRDRSFDLLFSVLPSPSELFWYWDPYYHQRRFQNENAGMSFTEHVFSFVFGDGDPNEGIEEQRWKMIGQYIGSNDGVVTAEELAPYLDVESAVKTDDDSYILPVLLHFDGQPQVDNEGNILYWFPSLQRTAAPKMSKMLLKKIFKEHVGGPDKFFKEKKWELSKTRNEERALVGGLGGFNLFGVILLSAIFKNAKFVEPISPFTMFVNDILPLLQVYAASFFAIPLARWVFIQKRNAEIEKRNRARELRAQALELPDIDLKRKILSARDMSERSVMGQHQIVYSTDKDISEQDYDEQEWDVRFKGG